MAHILEQLFGAFATLGLVLLVGYAPARLLLPSNLQRWFWLAVPLLGYATSAVVLGWLSIFLPLSSGAWLFLGATIGVSALVLLRGGLPHKDQAWLEQAAVGTLTVIALGIGTLPLWDRPELLAIGPNWDIEIYLPLAEYLKQFSTGFSLTDPAGLPFPGEPNPLLWRINFFDPRWAGLAFSQLHAVIGVALHQEAHQQFAGVLALLGALSAPAVFLFFRAAFGLDRTPSLLATTLIALNPATFYIVFWSFGQQVASLPLVPLALLTGLLALRRPGVPATLLAGLSLAALLATFIPAGLLYGLPFAALALHAGISSHSRRRVFGATLGVVGASFVLAPWAYLRGVLRAYHFLQEGGATGLTVGPDVTRFPPVAWALGLTSTPEGFSAGLPEPLSGVPGTFMTFFGFLLGGLMVAALIVAFRRRNTPLLACSLSLFALLAILRFVMPYPYGYLKLLPSGGFILTGLLVAGGWALWHVLPACPVGRPASALRLALRLGLSGGGLALLGATLLSTGGLVASMKQDSTAEYRGFEVLAKLVPAGSSVYLSGHEAYQGPKTGALAYFLRNAQPYGALRTGFSTFYRLRTDGVYDYAVFHEGEPIPKELYPDKEMVWQGLGVKVFRTPEDVAYFRDFGAASRPPTIEQSAGQGGAAGLRITRWQPSGYPDFSGWSPPLLGVLAETVWPSGGYLQVAGGTTAEILIPESADVAAKTTNGDPQTLVVTLASFDAQQATVSINGQLQGLTVAPGVASYPLGLPTGQAGAIRTPAQITLQTQLGHELYVKSFLVRRGNTATKAPAFFPEAALARWGVGPTGGELTLDLDYLGPDYQLVVDIYSKDGQRHYGWWSLPPGVTERAGSYRLRLDPHNQAAYLVLQGQETKLPGWQGQRGDGDYRAYLFSWRGDQAVRSVPLFEFTLSGDTVTGVKQKSGRLFIG